MASRPRMLISACLLGVECRYDGGGQMLPSLEALMERYELIPVCPEQLGGLSTPRCPCEIRGDRVMSRDGDDRTVEYEKGALEALRLCRLFSCEAAILKAKSPSCGLGCVYDGTFSGTLRPGDGVTAGLLKNSGVPVYTEKNLPEDWG